MYFFFHEISLNSVLSYKYTSLVLYLARVKHVFFFDENSQNLALFKKYSPLLNSAHTKTFSFLMKFHWT